MQQMDTSGDGELDNSELLSALLRVGIDAKIAQCTELVNSIDTDGNGQISGVEFEVALRQYRMDSAMVLARGGHAVATALSWHKIHTQEEPA